MGKKEREKNKQEQEQQTPKASVFCGFGGWSEIYFAPVWVT